MELETLRNVPLLGKAASRVPKQLSAMQLRYPREMTISRNKRQVMFQGQRRNPKIIVGDRSAGAPKLNEDSCIVFRSFPAGQQYPNRGLGQQSG